MDIPNAFVGKTEQPTSKELADALGPSMQVWNKLITRLDTDLHVTTQEWKSYSPKYGWHLKLKVKKRNIIHLSPCKGHVRVALVLGDRAMNVVRASPFTAKLRKIIDHAPHYPEGTGIVLDPANASDIPSLIKLAAIKLAN